MHGCMGMKTYMNEFTQVSSTIWSKDLCESYFDIYILFLMISLALSATAYTKL